MEDVKIVAVSDRYYKLVSSGSYGEYIGVFTVLTEGQVNDCAAYRACVPSGEVRMEAFFADTMRMAYLAARLGSKITEAEARAIWPDLYGLRWRD